MGRKKGSKNKIDNKITHKIKPIELPKLSTDGIEESEIEGVISEKISDDISNQIEPIEPSKTRLSKSERKQAEINDRLAKLTIDDYSQYGEMAEVIFDIISVRLGEHWKLNDNEKQSIGRPLARVAVKYIGDFKYYDELALGIVLIGVITPRIKHIKSNE